MATDIERPLAFRPCDDSDVNLVRFQTGHRREYRLLCRNCGVYGSVVSTPAQATEEWIHIHAVTQPDDD